MRDIVTSVNTWLKSKLPGVNFTFEHGNASAFPAVVVTCESVEEAGERRCPEAPLCQARIVASVITDSRDSFAARDTATKILDVLRGDSDHSVRIPMQGWDYEADPPEPLCTVFEMEVTRTVIVDSFDAKKPEMRNVRVEFGLRTRL